MTRTHTPGPWQAYHDSHGRFQLITDGLPLDPNRDGAQPGEGAANAALIAAAPDLLATLRDGEDIISALEAEADNAGLDMREVRWWWQRAVKEIAKAQGGE